MRFSAACQETGQPREDMGIGCRRRGGLCRREPISGNYYGLTRLRATEHNIGVGRQEFDSLEDLPAGRVGVLCQYRLFDAEDGRPYL